MSLLETAGRSNFTRSGSFTNRKFPPAPPAINQQCLEDTSLGFVIMLERTAEYSSVRLKDLNGHDLFVLSGLDITVFGEDRKRTYQRPVIAKGTTGRLLVKKLREEIEVRGRAHMNGLDFLICSFSEI